MNKQTAQRITSRMKAIHVKHSVSHVKLSDKAAIFFKPVSL